MRVTDRHALRAGRGRSAVCRSRRVCRGTADHAAHRRGLLSLSRRAAEHTPIRPRRSSRHEVCTVQGSLRNRKKSSAKPCLAAIKPRSRLTSLSSRHRHTPGTFACEPSSTLQRSIRKRDMRTSHHSRCSSCTKRYQHEPTSDWEDASGKYWGP